MTTRTDDHVTKPSRSRTADSTPGDPPPDRCGTTPPDGTQQDTHATDIAAEAVTAAEPGRGQVRGADPRVDVSSADSRPAPDDATTGTDRDTLKPGV